MVFLVINGVIHAAPMVSIPSDSGVAISNQNVFHIPASNHAALYRSARQPLRQVPSLRGSFAEESATFFCTVGIQVWPPTRITSWMSETDRPANPFSATFSGSMERAAEIFNQRLGFVAQSH